MGASGQDAVIHYIEAGLSLRQAAAFAGCHHTTISKAAERDEEFAERLERAERIGDALPLVRVIRASRKSWHAAAWLVRNNNPHARLRRERSEEGDQETADSMNRLTRMMREGCPQFNVKVDWMRGRTTVEAERDEVADQKRLLRSLEQAAGEIIGSSDRALESETLEREVRKAGAVRRRLKQTEQQPAPAAKREPAEPYFDRFETGDRYGKLGLYEETANAESGEPKAG